MSKKLLFDSPEWTPELIDKTWNVIDEIGKSYGLDYYAPQIEIITAEQMIDACSTGGLPNLYNHWSFGKSFISQNDSYRKTGQGLAYEIVLNSDPAIAYCMETNSMTMQTLVLAHAVCGHSSFFKNNYMFTQNTRADWIINYLQYARSFVTECEDNYGETAVERVLTAAHGLQRQGVDLYPKVRHKNKARKEKEAKQRQEFTRKNYKYEDKYFREASPYDREALQLRVEDLRQAGDYEYIDDENLLYVIEKTSPRLLGWQRELVRIVRKIAQYFYPQICTKTMNEGWACFWHYHILTDMHKQGYISEGSYLEFLHSHTSVVNEYSDTIYSFNPYYLGFKMFMDLKRICQEPTKEDEEWFPSIANTDWNKSLHYIMKNFNDASFIRQWLSPKLMRDLRIATLKYQDSTEFRWAGKVIHSYLCNDVCDDEGYRKIRNVLSDRARYSSIFPRVSVDKISRGRRHQKTLYLQTFLGPNKQKINKETVAQMMDYIDRLWGTCEIEVDCE